MVVLQQVLPEVFYSHMDLIMLLILTISEQRPINLTFGQLMTLVQKQIFGKMARYFIQIFQTGETLRSLAQEVMFLGMIKQVVIDLKVILGNS